MMFQVHYHDGDSDRANSIKCDTFEYESTNRHDRLETSTNLTDHCNTSPSSSPSSASSHDQNMKSSKLPPPPPQSSSLLSSNSLDCNHPNFIKNYFLTSRLHHISTWKMDLTDYVMNAMKELSASSSSLSMATKLSSVTSASSSLSSYFFSHKNSNSNNSSSKHPLHDHYTTNNRSSLKYKYQPSNIDDKYRTIMHIDMDCFFASVGIRDRPHLINTPIAVAHSLNGVNMSYSTSEIASCNYIARSKGVKNGMFIGHAKQLEPNLHIIPYEFEKYDHVSKCLYSVLLNHSNYVQAVSCDEAFIDVTYIVQSKLKGIVNGHGISNTHNIIVVVNIMKRRRRKKMRKMMKVLVVTNIQ